MLPFSGFIRSLEGFSESSGDFPLRGKVHFRSSLNMGFPREDYLLLRTDSDQEPLIEMAILTLAGPDGVLPKWVLEKILYEKENGGEDLHVFLDILNRRFWELFYQIDTSLNLKKEGSTAQETLNLIRGLVDCHHEVRAEWGMDLASLLLFWQNCMVSHNSYHDMDCAVDMITHLLDFPGVYAEPVHDPVRLQLPSRSALVLGSTPLGNLRSDGGILGQKIWMRYGSRLRFQLKNQWAFFFRLCSEETARLIKGAVGFFGHYDVQRVTIDLELQQELEFDVLGGKGCRLGTGACLQAIAPVSLMLNMRLNMEG